MIGDCRPLYYLNTREPDLPDRLAAVTAGPAQDDVVRGDLVPASARNADDGRLESRVLERLDLPAVVAHEVMVVLAAACGLEARDAVTEVDPLDEAAAVEAVEHAVDAREAYAHALGANAVVDLERRQAAVLSAEELDHLAPRGPAPAARGSQPLERVLGPARRRALFCLHER